MLMNSVKGSTEAQGFPLTLHDVMGDSRNTGLQPYKPEFGISDCRFSCYARFPIGAYYICPPNNMDGKMQNCKVQMKFTL